MASNQHSAISCDRRAGEGNVTYACRPDQVACGIQAVGIAVAAGEIDIARGINTGGAGYPVSRVEGPDGVAVVIDLAQAIATVYVDEAVIVSRNGTVGVCPMIDGPELVASGVETEHKA